MKQYGILGKGSGKLGSSVFAISGGEQIVRQYNPVVSNPNTPAQVAQRAKLKLMSQIAADLAPVLAIPKDGLKSARNQFVSKNIGNATFAENTAEVDYEKLQITGGSAAMPELGNVDYADGHVTGALASAAPEDITAVVYCVFKLDSKMQLSLQASSVIETAGAGRTFPFDMEVQGETLIVYAYGLKTGTTGFDMKYEDYEIGDATDVARLVTTRAIKKTSSALTVTVGKVVGSAWVNPYPDARLMLDANIVYITEVVIDTYNADDVTIHGLGNNVTVTATSNGETISVQYDEGGDDWRVVGTNPDKPIVFYVNNVEWFTIVNPD